jgi:hypothetical protein
MVDSHYSGKTDWTDGSSIQQLAAVSKRVRKTKVWIHGITGSLSTIGLSQHVLLWARLEGIVLHNNIPDKFIWKWSGNQQYSSASAYRVFFMANVAFPGPRN